jgi:ribosomal protein S18 acetylase RimI-like enzyme
VLVAAAGEAGPGRVVVRDGGAVKPSGVLSGKPDGGAVKPSGVVSGPSADWWQLTVGHDTPNEAERHVLSSGDNVGFAELVLDGTTAAVGRAAVVGDLVHLSKIAVDPACRRRGLGTEIMIALGDWGAERGAVRCVLQVMTGNQAALSLYDRLGYAEHHRYRYWRP